MKCELLNAVAKDRGSLIDLVVHMMNVPLDGLTLVCDDSDHSDYVNPIYQHRAFHLNIERGGIEEASPEYLLKAMKDPGCKHFVWISKAICDKEPLPFAWILAHELQHLLLSIEDFNLSVLNTFLTLTYGDVFTGTIRYGIHVPAEFVCESKAKAVVTNIFGQVAVNQFIAMQSETPDGKAYYELLQRMERDPQSYKIEERSKAILRRHKDKFIQLQTALREKGYDYKLDIEMLCS